MEINGTLINYYIHCKRQCYLHGNRLNLEDNSEIVRIGKAIHDERNKYETTEIAIDNISIDKLTKDYLVEVKKSDADINAAKWQLLYYLYILKSKGIVKRGKLEFCEKNKSEKKIEIIELDEKSADTLHSIINSIENLLIGDDVPERIEKQSCKKCAYYEYCYI